MACGVIVWILRSWLTTNTVATSWLLAAALSACMGLLQYFGQTQSFGVLIHTTALGEAFANLRQRNQFATLTSIGLLALIWIQVQRDTKTASMSGSGATKCFPQWVLLAACLLALGNAASRSRTGLLQWLLVVALAMLWKRGRQRRMVILSTGALTAYFLAAMTLPFLLKLMTGAESGGLLGRIMEESGCESRRLLWSNVVHLIAERPWTGWGWGELDYAHFITLYPGERFCDILDNAHNLPLHLAVELGIPAALLVCGGFMWWVFRQRPWRETDPSRQMAWGVLAVILLHSMLEYPLWYGPFQIAFCLSLGLLWRDRRTGAMPECQPKVSPVSSVQALAATVLIAIAGYAGWDYHRISQIYLTPEDRDAAYRDDTLPKIRGSWLFRDQVRFAELTITPLTRENAQWTFDTARALLHYSPEPRIIEKVIESAVMLGRDDEALIHLARYRAAFPVEHARWAQEAAAAPERLQLLK